MKTKIVFALIISFTVASCKYEEGPSLSFRSKKARLSGNWKIQFVSLNGSDITSGVQSNLGTNYVLEIKKNGTFHESGNNLEDTGTWTLAHEKSHLMMLSNLQGAEEEHWEILRLTHDELWIRHDHSGAHVVEFHYIQ